MLSLRRHPRPQTIEILVEPLLDKKLKRIFFRSAKLPCAQRRSTLAHTALVAQPGAPGDSVRFCGLRDLFKRGRGR